MIVKIFFIILYKKINGTCPKCLNLINLKFRKLKWIKLNLKNLKELWWNLECEFCILIKKNKTIKISH